MKNSILSWKNCNVKFFCKQFFHDKIEFFMSTSLYLLMKLTCGQKLGIFWSFFGDFSSEEDFSNIFVILFLEPKIESRKSNFELDKIYDWPRIKDFSRFKEKF